MSVLWLLVGRGGSRGVPGKNMRRIGDRTLIEWKLRAALAAGATGVVVSSDSPEIRAEALRCGAVGEIVRPHELASDTATTADVVRHALQTLGEPYDAVMLLEPSAPFTTAEQYRTAQMMMQVKDADAVIGMKEVAPHPAFVGDVRDDGDIMPVVMQFQRMQRRRQDFRPQWTMSGSVYLFRVEPFLATGDVYGGRRIQGLMQDRVSGHEIDTMEDLAVAAWYWQRGLVT